MVPWTLRTEPSIAVRICTSTPHPPGLVAVIRKLVSALIRLSKETMGAPDASTLAFFPCLFVRHPREHSHETGRIAVESKHNISIQAGIDAGVTACKRREFFATAVLGWRLAFAGHSVLSHCEIEWAMTENLWTTLGVIDGCHIAQSLGATRCRKSMLRIGNFADLRAVALSSKGFYLDQAAQDCGCRPNTTDSQRYRPPHRRDRAGAH